jgi:acetyltransferase-like isoleucine patch superfamily enzyme
MIRTRQGSVNRRDDLAQHAQWARAKEKGAVSILSFPLMAAYRIKALRRLCLSLASRLEGGDMIPQLCVVYYTDFTGVSIGHYSYGDCLVPGLLPSGTKVGNYCSVAEGLRVFRRNHPTDFLSQHPFFYNNELGLLIEDTIEGVKDNPLNIGHDVWIGGGVTILPMQTHERIIVGAGSVVTNNIPPFTIYVGNPARCIRERFSQEICALIEKSQWWNLPLSELGVVVDKFVSPITKANLEECLAKLEGGDAIPR